MQILLLVKIHGPRQDIKRYPNGRDSITENLFLTLGPLTKLFERFILSFKLYSKILFFIYSKVNVLLKTDIAGRIFLLFGPQFAEL